MSDNILDESCGWPEEALEKQTETFDAAAVSILGEVQKMLAEEFDSDSRIVVGEVFGDSPYASSRYDAGACLVVEIEGHELLDVRVEIPSSEEYEGEMLGWGFGFGATWEGGEIGPGGILGNFTEDVWADTSQEFDSRLEYLRDNDFDFAYSVAEEIKEKLGVA